MNILFACGGTAGHINPAVALARLFLERNPGVNFLFVGAEGGMETRLVPKEGFELKTVRITNFHRSFKGKDIRHNLNTLRNLGISRRQAGAILDRFRPDLVVGTGGTPPIPWCIRPPEGAFPPQCTNPTPSRGLPPSPFPKRRTA
jgi:UDP-N-acetylglucosamine--N-acetylmuramyl-(pentapeptide) pyrophosphoryl-undecaprenol N-acetylglucosamine transferase